MGGLGTQNNHIANENGHHSDDFVNIIAQYNNIANKNGYHSDDFVNIVARGVPSYINRFNQNEVPGIP